MQNAFPTHAAAYLAERGIPESFALACGIRPLPADAVRRAMWGPEDEKHSVPGDALEIPYIGLDGKTPMEGLDGLAFKRFRVFDPRTKEQLNGGKSVRYMSPAGAGHRLYVPPVLGDLLAHGARVLVVTEGEMKAVSAAAHGIACAAIGGVTLWHDPESANGGDEQSETTPVHPELLELVAKVGRVVVLADSDAKKNELVMRSMTTLAEALKVQAPDAVVAFAVVPPPEKRGAKWGLDDWLVAKGSKSVEGLLTWYANKASESKAALGQGGYKALGYDDKAYHVWSNAKGTLEAIAKKDLFNSALLTSLCGLRWAQASYPLTSESGEMRVNWTQLGGDLEASCVAEGPFDPDRLRGPGVWQHPHDTSAVIVNGDELWSSSGAPVSRVGGDHVYPRIKNLGVRVDTPSATAADASQLLDALRTWQWQRGESDAHLMLGWLGLGYITGALNWRSHMSLTGPRGTGKSELMRLAQRLLGSAAIYSEGNSTEAGIRQAVKSSAPALLLDEGEADGQHLGRVLEFLRVASSGGTMLKGTSDQAGARFVLRAIGLIAGISPPQMNAADASRFVRLTLQKPSADVARNKHPLLDRTTTDAEDLGVRLFARAIRSWPRFVAALRLVSRCIQTTEPRYIDTVAPLIASAWVMLHDHDMNEAEAIDFASQIKLGDDLERMADASDEDALLSTVLGKRIRTSFLGGAAEMTVYGLLEHVVGAKCNSRGREAKELASYGMKLVPGNAKGTFELRINPKAGEFRGILKGTPYERADITEALRRIPNSFRGQSTDRIGTGTPVRYHAIELSIEAAESPIVAAALE